MSVPITGIKFPFEFNAGRVRLSSDAQHIKETVHHLITINKGEVVMNLDMGSDLFKRVFSPVNVSALIAHDISSVLRTYEKRIKLSSVDVSQDQMSLGIVHIGVNFEFMNAYQQASFNYPVNKG